jgi:HD-like signal output (HDOD) protein
LEPAEKAFRSKQISTMTGLAALPRMARDASGWAALWRDAEIPILRRTAEQIEELRAREDEVDARLLAPVVAADPLMCLKLLAHVSRHRSARRITDTETATAALVMMGIGPFFRHFGVQPTVEEHLHGHDEALAGLLRVLERAGRAARFALGFAAHRMDPDAEVVHEAALLHDFAEMLLWCHAPALALEIKRRQAADPTLRSATVQGEVLHAELVGVQQALMRAWRLPELLVRISGDHRDHGPQVRNVMLAIRLARHSQDGWDNAALPDDVRDIAQLLNLKPEATLRLVQDLDS